MKLFELEALEKATGDKVAVSNGKTVLGTDGKAIPEEHMLRIPKIGQYVLSEATCSGSCTIGKPETRCPSYCPGKCNGYDFYPIEMVNINATKFAEALGEKYEVL